MSIVEIAKKAGVGVGTVSRFFNAPETISRRTAAKIRPVLSNTNFNLSVRRPGPKTAERVGIRTGVVVLLLLGGLPPDRILRSPAYPLLLNGIQKALFSSGMTLMYAYMEENSPVPEQLNKRHCDGVIVLGALENKKRNRQLLSVLKKLPAVWSFRNHSDPDNKFDHVFYNNDKVARAAAAYLHAKGHRSVAFFNQDSHHDAFATRQAQFQEEAGKLGLKTALFAAHDDNKCKCHQILAENFLKKCGDITGAFFCADDAMLGIRSELRFRGFDLEKLDSIGCDNDDTFLQFLDPRPATIDLKLEEVGCAAVSRLLKRINCKGSLPPQEIRIDPEAVPPERKNTEELF